MACTLSNKCANNLSKRTVLLQLIISKTWSHVFFGTQCIGYLCCNYWLRTRRLGLRNSCVSVIWSLYCHFRLMQATPGPNCEPQLSSKKLEGMNIINYSFDGRTFTWLFQKLQTSVKYVKLRRWPAIAFFVHIIHLSDLPQLQRWSYLSNINLMNFS